MTATFPGPDGKANAAFVVRAVNSHNAMFKALEAMLAYGDSKFKVNRQVAVDMAHAALNLSAKEATT